MIDRPCDYIVEHSSSCQDGDGAVESHEGKRQDASPLRKRRHSTADTPEQTGASSHSSARKRTTPTAAAVSAHEVLLAQVQAQLCGEYDKEQVAGLCDLQKALTSGA
jgi:hypothetical protein